MLNKSTADAVIFLIETANLIMYNEVANTLAELMYDMDHKIIFFCLQKLLLTTGSYNLLHI